MYIYIYTYIHIHEYIYIYAHIFNRIVDFGVSDNWRCSLGGFHVKFMMAHL